LHRDDQAGLIRGARVKLLAESHDVDAGLTEGRSHGGRRVRFAGGNLQLHHFNHFLGHNDQPPPHVWFLRVMPSHWRPATAPVGRNSKGAGDPVANPFLYEKPVLLAADERPPSTEQRAHHGLTDGNCNTFTGKGKEKIKVSPLGQTPPPAESPGRTC